MKNTKYQILNTRLGAKRAKYLILSTYLTATLVLLVFIGLFPHEAQAAQLSVGISPPILQITAQPPASIEAPISIKNFTQEQVTFNIVLKPFKPTDKENGQLTYISEKEAFKGKNPKIFDTMQIQNNGHSIQQLTLSPLQEKELTLHIGLPENELYADYYFSILFLAKNNLSTDSVNASQAVGGLGLLVLLSIGQKGPAKGLIEEFSVPWFVEKGPVPFTLRVTNTGHHVFVPNGTIVIKNMFGQTIGNVELLPVNVLSQSTRSLVDSFQSPEATIPAKFQIPNTMWHESFLLGPYTATLSLQFAQNGQIYSQTIRFFAMPVQGFIVIIVAIFSFLVIKNRIKRYRK